MDQRQRSKANKTKPAEQDSNAGIMTLLRNQPQGAADQDIYSTASRMERTIFVVDLSKLEAETDTLVDALVFYHPEIELKKNRYEQRCSQLIGISMCLKNLTKKYPKYVHLKGSGFAVRSMGGVYLMGLSSRLEEPSSCVVSLAELIHKIFQFYHHSPEHVLQSCSNDWSRFTSNMSNTFNSISDFVAKDKHSVPAMFRPLPYIDTSTCKKGRQELYLVCSHVLRSCQNLAPVIGGCVMYNSKLVLSQFPSDLTEMLVLLGSGVMDLKHHTVLQEGVVPDKVWVLQVFLTRKQKKMAWEQREKISTIQESYQGMNANPQLANSTLQWRLQPNASTPSAAGSKQAKKQTWSRRSHKNGLSYVSSIYPSSKKGMLGKGGAKEEEPRKPLSTSTPQQGGGVKHGSGAASNSTTVESPSVDAGTRGQDQAKNKPRSSTQSGPHRDKRKSSASSQQESLDLDLMNDTDDVYEDAMSVDPTMALGPELLRLYSNSSPGNQKESESGENKVEQQLELRLNDDVPVKIHQPNARLVHGTGSTSSEGFATPSPTPPRHSSMAVAMGGHAHSQRDDSAGPELALSYQTANESFFCGTEDEGTEKGKGHLHENVPALQKNAKPAEKDVTTAGPGDGHKTQDAKKSLEESDDFIDPDELERLLQIVRKDASDRKPPDSSKSDRLNLSDSIPPPVPHRSSSFAVTMSAERHSAAVTRPTRSTSEAPPLPPRRIKDTKPPPASSQPNDALYLPSLTSDPPPLEFDEVDGSKIDRSLEDDVPPIPPQIQILESPELILPGKLDGPLNLNSYSDTEKFVAIPSDQAELDALEADRQSSWIYGTINRKANPEAMKAYKDMNGEDSPDFAKEELELTDSQELEVSGLKEASPGTAGSVEKMSSEVDQQLESADLPDGSLANNTDIVEVKNDSVHEVTVDAKWAGTAGTTASANGSDVDSTVFKPKQSQLMHPEVARTGEELTLDAGDDPSARREINPASELTVDGKTRAVSSEKRLIESENNYELDDYCIVELMDNGGSNGDICHKNRNNIPGAASQEEHIYEFDESDQSDTEKRQEERSNGRVARNPLLTSSQDRFRGRRYEEISDDVALKRRPRDSIAESESSDSATKTADVEDVESKNSSMTVTLDLSHIDKEDPLYSSAGDNRLSSGRSSSNEAGPSMSTARSSGDTHSTESSEEAGRDGMVTPVEITYNESMFNLVREKLEGPPSQGAVNLDQTKSAVPRARDDDDAMSNDSAEYSSLPDEDDSSLMPNTRAAIEAHRKSKDWLSKTMERPALTSQGKENMEKFGVYVQCYMDTYIILLTEADIASDKYNEDILHELWRPLAEQLLHLDSILEDRKDPVENTKVSNCIATYSSRERLCEAKPQSAAYHFRHAVRRAHQEYARDPSLRQLSLSKEHCRMLSQNVHGREVYVQPSGCAGDAMCLHGLIERNMKAKSSVKQQPADAPKVMLI